MPPTKQANLNAMIELIDKHIRRTQRVARQLQSQPERERLAIAALLPEIERLEKRASKAKKGTNGH
jgi:hypothetical protein